MDTRLGRRVFLRRVAATATLAAGAGRGLASGDAPESAPSGGQVARAGEPFPVPPDLAWRKAADGALEATLEARTATVAVAGFSPQLMTYNGAFPGPTLRVREGDRLRLRFRNGLTEATNLHWHGLHIDPAIDDALLSIPPGGEQVYDFTLPAGSAGTAWYHPHVHGEVARQLHAGLAGAIVISGPPDEATALRAADDRLLILRDMKLTNGALAVHGFLDWRNGMEGSLQLVNGVVQPVITAHSGLMRLRLLNAANARYFRLQLEGHTLHLAATDAGLIAAPVALTELLLAPGERAEVLVSLAAPGRYRLLNLPYSRGLMNGGTGTTVLATLEVPAGLAPAALPTGLTAIEDLRPLAEGLPAAGVALGEDMHGGRFFIDGRSFDVNRVDARATHGTMAVVEVTNPTSMDHPMHLHTYPFQVLSRNGVPEPYAAWKDTVNVARGGHVRLAVPFRDYTGTTVYHCHILEHEDLGMMGVLVVS